MPEVSASRGVIVQMPLFKPVGGLKPAATHDVHAISIPARAFTGDFYFLHRANDRLWFALGDVAGKGLPAAVVMAMIQEELEQRIVSCARPARSRRSHRPVPSSAFSRPLNGRLTKQRCNTANRSCFTAMESLKHKSLEWGGLPPL